MQTENEIEAEKPSPTTDFLPSDGASCSGFAVVLRYGGNRYKGVHRPDEIRGISTDEVWIFGEPQRSHEIEMWRAVAPCLGRVPEEMIHRIPKTSSPWRRKWNEFKMKLRGFWPSNAASCCASSNR